MSLLAKYEGAEKVFLCEQLHGVSTEVWTEKSHQHLATIYCADTVVSNNPTPAHHILMDAFKLHRISKKLFDGISRIVGQVEVDPDEYTKEGMLLILKELIE